MACTLLTILSWDHNTTDLLKSCRDVKTKRCFTSDFAHWLKQIRSLFLTNRSELSLFCLHPPEKIKGKTMFILHGVLKPRFNGSPLRKKFSPVIALTSRPHTMVDSVPTRDRYR